jgi:hypothetical protein
VALAVGTATLSNKTDASTLGMTLSNGNPKLPVCPGHSAYRGMVALATLSIAARQQAALRQAGRQHGLQGHTEAWSHCGNAARQLGKRCAALALRLSRSIAAKVRKIVSVVN